MSNGATQAFSQKTFTQQLKKYYTFYTGGFVAFVIVLGIAGCERNERRELDVHWSWQKLDAQAESC